MVDSRRDVTEAGAAQGAAQGEEMFGDAVGRLFERFEMRGVLGRVWSVLYLENRPLDARELRARLGVSTGALSAALNDLVELGFVHRVGVPGERRFFYRAEGEMWPLITRVIRERERARLVDIIDTMKTAAERLEAADGGKAPAEKRTAGLEADSRAEKVRHIIGIGTFVLDLIDAVTERTKVEMLAAQKWLEVSSRLGGEPLNRLRRRINAVQLGRKK